VFNTSDFGASLPSLQQGGGESGEMQVEFLKMAALSTQSWGMVTETRAEG